MTRAASRSKAERRVTLLGPQRLQPTLGPTLESLGIRGRIATVTAGWQEREGDDRELGEHLGGRAINLGLYERAEEVFRRDPEFARAHQERQAHLREMQELYNVRLDWAMRAAYDLLAKNDARDVVTREIESAIRTVRDLDAQHLADIRAVREEFDQRWRPQERLATERHMQEIATILRGVDALAIAGGHVIVLVNRLLLFDIVALSGTMPVIAWSAGAMAISERIVLFYDFPPHGPGNAEVVDAGLALCRGIVPLPHARHRLRLDHAHRVGVFARRFAPASCVPMDEGARLDVSRSRLGGAPGTMRLSPTGDLAALEAA